MCCLAICHYSITSYTMVQATSETNRTKKYKNWINAARFTSWYIPMPSVSNVSEIFLCLTISVYIHTCISCNIIEVPWKSVPDWIKIKTNKKYTKWNTHQNPNSSPPQTANYTIRCLEWGVEGCVWGGDARKKFPLPIKTQPMTAEGE